LPPAAWAATGFRSDYAWIHIPGVVNDGRVARRRGVTDEPGLYFLGLSWQHTSGSALLGFVNDDAADHTGEPRATQAGEPTGPPGSSAAVIAGAAACRLAGKAMANTPPRAPASPAASQRC
jgi:hypothetical protein